MSLILKLYTLFKSVFATIICPIFPSRKFRFHKIFLISFLISIAGIAIEANAATYYSRQSGSWTSNTTWSLSSGGVAVGVGVFPIAGDIVIIERGFNVTLTANAACASISFTTVTATSLTLAGFQLDVSGAITIPRPGAGINLIAVGTGTLNAASIAFTIGGATVRHQITISSGTVTVSGNITTDNAGASASITFTGAGILNAGGGVLAAGGTLTTFAGSTVNYNGAVQTVKAVTYQGNLTLSGSGAKTTTGTTVNGVLSMQGTATTAGTVATYGAAASLEYKGSAAQVTGIEFPATFSGTGGVLINNANGVTLNAIRTIGAASNLTIGNTVPNSTFNDGGFQLTSTGTLNLISGTYNLGSVGTATVFPSFTTINISSGTTVGYVAGVAQTVSATPSYYNLITSGAGQKNAGGAIISVGGDLTNSSVFDLNTRILNVTGSISNSGTIRFSGISNGLAISSGTIEYYGATQNVAGGTYTTLNITAAGPKTAVGSITATTLDNGGASNVASILNMSGNTLSATTINNTNATIRFSGDGLAVNTGTVEYYGATQTVASGSYATLNITAAGTKTAGGNITVTTLLDNGGSSDVAAILDMAGNTLTSASTQNTGATIRFSGAANGVAVNTGIVEYYGATQTVASGSYATLNITAAGTKTAGGNITVTTLLDNGGSSDVAAILDMAGNTLTSASTQNTGATIRFSGAANGVAVNTGTVEYYGATQTLASGSYATLNITAAGTKTAGGNITVTTLLDNGGSSDVAAILDMAGNTLTSASTQNTGATIRFSGAANGVAVNTGTVEYYGATQTVSSGSYTTLNITAAGTKTAGGNITVTTLLDNGGSSDVAAILDMAGNTLSSASTQNTGATIRFSGASNGIAISSGTVEYYGPNQTIGSGTYNALLINQSAGNATLGGNTTVNSTLTLSAGKVNTGANTFTMASTASNIVGASTARFIVGNLEWSLPAGASTRKFEIGTTVYAPVTLVSSAVAGTVNVVANVNQGAVPNENTPIANSSGIDPTKKADHYWTLSKSGAGTYTTNATFDFSNTTNTGTTGNYRIRRYEPSPTYWTDVSSSVAGSTISTTGGLTSFGDFEVGERNPTPAISTQPNSVVICQGGLATFTVAATSVPSVTYQWRKGGVNITGATSISLSINPVSLSDAGNYDCVVSNINGSATSNSVSLTVNPIPTLSGVLQTASVCDGNAATITLTGLLASATFTINYSINAVAQTPITGVVSNASGITTFSTPVLTAANNGQALQITGLTVTSSTPNCTQAFTQSISLSVNVLPADKTVSALSTTVCGGSSTNIQVLLSSVGVNYQLRNNADNSLIGAPVAGTGGTINLSTGILSSTTTYNVLATTASTSCNIQMSITPTVNLSPLPVVQTLSAPGLTSYCLGTPNVTVSLSSSEAGFSYELYKNGAASGTIKVGTGTALSYLNLDAGTYTVYGYYTTTPSCGTLMSGSVAVTADTPAAISVQPTASQTLCEGSALNLSVTASGTSLSYQWRKGGTPIGGATSSSYSIGVLVAADAGTYTVDVISGGVCGNTVTSANAVVNVNVAAVITTQPLPASQTLCVGSNLTLNVVAGGSGTLSYQWKKNGVNIGGATASTFNIASVASSDAANYTVVVTSSGVCVPASVTSNIAAVIVESPAAISVQPTASQTLCEGSALNLSVTASGTSLTYQWKKGGAPIGGATSSSYSIGVLVAADAGTYTVDVISGGVCGNTVASANAVVNVNVAAVITTQPLPASQTLCVGSNLTLNVVAGGSGTLSYQWKKNGVNIGGATAATFNIASVSVGDAANYTVEVTSSGVCVPASVTSNIAAIIVEAPAAISVQPTASQTLCEGSALNLSVTASGTSLSYQWRKGGTPIGGATSSSYSIGVLVAADAGTYTVDVTSGGVCGNTVTSANAVVNVNVAAVITSQPLPASQTLCVGSNLTLNVVAGGSGTLSYQWKKNGVNIGGATASTFTIASVSSGDAANYTVEVTSSGVCVPASVTSNIAAVIVESPAAISVQPTASQTLCEGSALNLSVTASGTSLTYQWKKGGAPIGGATSSSYSIGVLVAADAGTYTVDVISGGVCGNTVTSANAVVNVNVAAVITTQPLPASQTLCVGSNLTLNVVAGGSGTLSYQWKKNGVNIGGATASTFNIASVASSDAANYTVVVTSSGVCVPASVTSNIAAVIVEAPAAISVQPTASQTLCEGTALNLSVTASGTSLSYQWKKGGTPIGGATSSSYSIGVLVAADAGTYTVDVTSGGVCGNTVTSANAVVAINLIPVGNSVVAGTYSTCSGVALNIAPTSSVPGTTYTWLGSNGSGGTGNITDAPVNISNSPVNITYTVTPRGPSSTFCLGSDFTIIATVNPSPSFSIANTAPTLCGGINANITLNSPTSGAVMTLASVNYNGVAGTTNYIGGETFTNGQKITESYTNPGPTPLTVTYTFSVSANGCSNVITQQTSVVVNPDPTMSIVNAATEICSGSPVSITLNSPTSGAIITLTGINYNGVVGTLSAPRTYTPGSIISETLLNNTNGPITVTYSFTVAGNGCSNITVFTTDVLVNPNPSLTITNSTPSICSNSTPAISFTSPTANAQFTLQSVTYGSLLNGAYAAGATFNLPGSISEGNLVNNTNSPIVVTYTFRVTTPTNPVCPLNITTQSTTVTVLPTPAFTFTNTAPLICSGSQTNITLNTTVSGAQLRLKSVNYGTASGSLTVGALYTNGQVVSDILTNSTNSTATVTYDFESFISGCTPSASQQITVDVKPTPVITNTALQLQNNICNGTALNFLPTSTTDPGTTYTWASSVTGSFTGITASGAGAIIDIPVNTANTIGNITYIITPHLNGCSGTPVNYVVTVNPSPTANGSDLIICSGQNALISINAGPANVTGTTFSWVAVPSSNVTGAANDNGSTINQVLSLTDFSVGTVTYQVTPTANGCNGTVKNIVVTINPVPTVNAGTDFEVCEPATIPVTGTIGGAATSGIWVIVSGAGSISSSAVSGTQVTATYTVSPTDVATTIVLRLDTDDPAGPCGLVSDLVQIQINRGPTVTVPADNVVCEPSDLSAMPINLSGTIGGSATTGNWSVISGAGSLSASTLTGSNVTSQYIIDPSDVGNIITLRLTSNDPDGVTGVCVRDFKETNITINRAAVVSAGPDLQLCEDTPSITLQGSQSGAPTTVVWSGGIGIFSSTSIVQPDYSFSNPSEINTSITLTIMAIDPDGGGPCQDVTDNMILKVNPLPVVTFFGLPPGTPPQLVENNPPITLNGSKAGGLFTILPSTSVIGSTTINVVDRVTFDPSAVELGANFITYTFTDPNGCTNFDTQEIFVNPVTNVDFGVQGALVNSNGEFELCGDLGDVKLLGFPPPSDGFPPETKFTSEGTNAANMVIVNVGADYFIKTDGLVSDTYRIRYTFKNQFGGVTFKEKSIRIFASPVASFTSANNCINSDVVFTDSSTINPTPFPTTIGYWEWNFGDGEIRTGQNQSKRYSTSGIYDVTLKVSTPQGCANTSVPYKLRVGDVPIVDFDWSSICNNDQTNFQDNTNPGTVSHIASYTWDFGDGSVLTGDATLNNPKHQYTAFGTYNVKLNVLTDDGCDNSLIKRVFILPYNTLTPVAGAEYLEGFETSDGGWIEQAFEATNSTPLNIIKSDTSWIWGPPTGATITSAPAGSSKVWWTGGKNNENTYYSNENSVVNGPCFDLSQLQRPMVALDYFSDVENNLDGAVLQYSINGGIDWIIVGPPAGQTSRDEGINWFNGVGIFSNPGTQPIGPSIVSYGWTDKQGAWKNARFNLNMIPVANRNQVRIRIAFSSNDGNAAGFDGFAFDNFFVGEKKRNVLVEHFTTSALTASTNADIYLNTLLANQITINHPVSDFNDIQYHVNFSGIDYLNRDNPADPAARALYYGVSQPPYTVMDGLPVPGGTIPGDYKEITSVEIDRRALVDNQFELTLDTIPTNKSRTISVKLTLKANKAVNVPLIAHVALLEDDVTVPNTGVFKNVLRKQLFGSDGETINNTFGQGDSRVIQKLDVDINAAITDPSKLMLIGFVLDKNSKEIYQSIVVKAPRKSGSPIVGVKDNDPIPVANLNSIQLFPNPANGLFNFGIPGEIQSDTQWEIIDQRGIAVLKGDFAKSASGLLAVDVSTLSNAVYYVVIHEQGGAIVRKKLIVMNRN